MRLDLLRPLYERPGPWASVYIDTSRDARDTSVEPRWEAARESLARAGCDPHTVHALQDAVLDHPGRPGRHGLALFATSGEVIMRQPLTAPPRAAIAVYEPLPHVMPMISQLGEELEEHRQDVLDQFHSQIERDDSAGNGLSEVVSHLSRGQVDTLLLIDDPSSTEQLWIGPQPHQVSDDPELLRSSGFSHPPRVRADAAMLRALVGTDGSIVLVDPEEHNLHGGVAAVLRHAGAR
ncbi:hypothetical protein [Actinoplanes palleronii]|uniref:Uncharacterized protein n=1 Tax=Actinoplanes palleronii TaxID=113570 RepID=A0ABQ4BER3_9ACTN|nr:hypothetical protein [Actinoplanes palleronii]GIE69170.1 hypothetical protein Apa02nite_052780 [Actinoplanes palleronii]